MQGSLLLGFAQATLQVCQDLIGSISTSYPLPSLDRSLAAINKTGLHVSPGSGGKDSLFDELSERLTLPQCGFDCGSNFWPDADGGEGGRAHWVNA